MNKKDIVMNEELKIINVVKEKLDVLDSNIELINSLVTNLKSHLEFVIDSSPSSEKVNIDANEALDTPILILISELNSKSLNIQNKLRNILERIKI
jgi:hypothetical protein